MSNKKVFISYRHINDDIANRLVKCLEDSKIEYWIDKEHLDPNDPNYDQKIIQALSEENFTGFVCIWTKDSVDFGLHLQAEINNAFDGYHLPLFFVVYGDAKFPRDLSYHIGHSQFLIIDVENGKPNEETEKEAFKDLMNAINSGKNELRNNGVRHIIRNIHNDFPSMIREKAEFLSKADFHLPSNFAEELLPRINISGDIKKNISELLNIEGKQSFVIHGNGGFGKSVSLKYFMRESLNKQGVIPIYVPIKDLSIEKYSRSNPIISYIVKNYLPFTNVNQEIEEGVREFFVNFNAKTDRYWFLIDGQNEICDELATSVNNDIRLLNSNKNNNLIVTTRFLSDYRDGREIGFFYATAEKLSTDEQSIPFLRRLGQEKGIDYIQRIDRSIIAMLSNPMMLTIFCNTFDNEDYLNNNNEDLKDINTGGLIQKSIDYQLDNYRELTRNEDKYKMLSLLSTVFLKMFYNDQLDGLSFKHNDFIGVLSDVVDKYFDSTSTPLFMDCYLYRERRNDLTAIVNKVESFISGFLCNILDMLDYQASTSTWLSTYHWKHQTFQNWFIARGFISLFELDKDEYDRVAKLLAGDNTLRFTGGYLGDRLTNDSKYDDYLEQTELLFDLAITNHFDFDNVYDIIVALLYAQDVSPERRGLIELKCCESSVNQLKQSKISSKKPSFMLIKFLITALYNLTHSDKKIYENDQKLAEFIKEHLDFCLDKLNETDDFPSEKIKTSELSRLYTVFGAYYQFLFKRKLDTNGTMEEALEYNQKALDLRKEPEELARSYINIGTIYFYLKDIQKAYNYQKKAYDQLTEIVNDPETIRNVRPKKYEEIQKNRHISKIRMIGNEIQIKEKLDKKDVDIICDQLIEVSRFFREICFRREFENLKNTFTSFVKKLPEDEELIKKVYEVAEIINEDYKVIRPYAEDDFIQAFYQSLPSIEFHMDQKSLKKNYMSK